MPLVSFKPEMQELPEQIVVSSILFVDQLAAAVAEAGDIVVPISKGKIAVSHIKSELGQVLTGEITGRSDENEVTVFKSVGNAVQDLFVAHFVLGKMTQLNL